MRHLAVGEALDVGRQIGMRLQPGPAGDAGQHEAPVLALVGLRQLRQHLVHLLDGHLDQLGQQLGCDGLHRHQQNGLEGAAQLCVLHLIQTLIPS